MSVSETLEEGSVCKKSTLRRAVCGVHCLQLGLFSNTLSLCFSLNARDQVSHPYKTTGKIQVPKISAGERPQTYALDRTATGTGKNIKIKIQKL